MSCLFLCSLTDGVEEMIEVPSEQLLIWCSVFMILLYYLALFIHVLSNLSDEFVTILVNFSLICCRQYHT